ncbi:hypothetical protein MLD38_005288 [Melastoma candidum]|uniref:Uncharacterized protein n=1 Tax=Melastoma candidum TaxID=119954 RepID=A0ACB9S8E0_9MYRT|nr:hypothetical protein MLD38_005288 [Melastoma candidum]
MGDLDKQCNPGLFLGLGIGRPVVRHDAGQRIVEIHKSLPAPTTGLDLSFPDVPQQKSPRKALEDDCHAENSNTPSYGSCSPHRDNHGDADNKYDSGKEGSCRKKLRLSKEQSTLLEESFNLHNTLTPAQKQSLAHQLKLKAWQVEVWFQNRRARNKLKQMEVDCEYMKKCCESLREDNCGLKKEL